MIDNELQEEWRPVKEYEGLYEVSSFGRVRSIRNGHIMKQKVHKGYLCISLHNKGIKWHSVHRLVAFAFQDICGEYFAGADVNHKDENTQNNKAINLEFCNRKYNINYGTGVKRRSKRTGQYKDGVLLKVFESCSLASRETGVNVGNICCCCNGTKEKAGGFEWRYL